MGWAGRRRNGRLMGCHRGPVRVGGKGTAPFVVLVSEQGIPAVLHSASPVREAWRGGAFGGLNGGHFL